MRFPSDRQLDWLQAEILASRPKYAKAKFPFRLPPARALAQAFQRRWGVPVGAGWITRVVETHWLGLPAERLTKFTWAQRRYLYAINGRKGMTAARRAELFNRRFGTDFEQRAITAWMSDRKRRAGGKRFAGLPGNGQFTASSYRPEYPIGTVVVMESSKKEPRLVMVKVDRPHPYTGRRGYMRPLRLEVWERMHGPVPKHHAVVHLDGDPGNCDLDNLELVTRAELARLNQMKWRDLPADRETRLAAVAAARLKQAAFDVAPSPSTAWARRKRAEMEGTAWTP